MMNLKNPETKLFVFDAETIGLHGECFAVAGIIITVSGVVIDDFFFSCDPRFACGTHEGREWVMQHVVPGMPESNCETPNEVRERFWQVWETWRKECMCFCETPWPVETSLLSACIRDSLQSRYYKGPYPLYDVSSVLAVLGIDPLATQPRRDDETPAHNPLADSRQSARLLIEALGRITHAD